MLLFSLGGSPYNISCSFWWFPAAGLAGAFGWLGLFGDLGCAGGLGWEWLSGFCLGGLGMVGGFFADGVVGLAG